MKITPSVGMWGYPVSFDALDSIIPEGNVIEYSWDFGDGATGQGIKTTHIYVRKRKERWCFRPGYSDCGSLQVSRFIKYHIQI